MKNIDSKKISEKDNELLLSSVLFITDVFYLKITCIMKLRNNF